MSSGTGRRVGAAVMLLAATGTAAAHGTPGPADAHWTFDAWVLVPLLLSLGCYAAGSLRLSSRLATWSADRRWHALSYGAAWLVLAAALVSPLHWLGEHLFAFHMIEHELVMAVAAPLLVLARPIGVLLWGVPQAWRRPLARSVSGPAARSSWDHLTRPRNATVLHGLAIWLWHIPSVFDATLVDVTLHRLQHLSFLLTALLFWWSMLRRTGRGVAVWHLFVTMLHTSALGALIALAPRVLYHVQTADAPGFGLTPLEDQQLAGVIMWVPSETVYAGAALALAALWIRRSRSRTDRTAAGASAAVPESG